VRVTVLELRLQNELNTSSMRRIAQGDLKKARLLSRALEGSGYYKVNPSLAGDFREP
jgi:hypothetical protein